jgi:aspartate racemase
VKHGIKIIEPSEEGVRKEMTALFGREGIKAGARFERSRKNKDLLLEIVDEFKRQGAECVILGCTEIPLCLDQEDTELRLINPTGLLAKAAVTFALEE